jgi:hypothetical protein
MADAGVQFAIEAPLPTIRFENLALTSTRSADNTGVRVQVLCRQPDGSWLRIIDRPEVPQPWKPSVHNNPSCAARAVKPITGSPIITAGRRAVIEWAQRRLDAWF